MPKITIYVPDDLKAEMDAVESEQPNWSAFAQDAFRAECGRLSNRKRSKGKMDAVIERLRVSKAKVEDKENNAGQAAGRRWAMERAEYDQLYRAEKFVAITMLSAPAERPEPLYATLYAAIASDDSPEQYDIEAFWERICGTERGPTEGFVFGFMDAVDEVWHEVKDHL